MSDANWITNPLNNLINYELEAMEKEQIFYNASEFAEVMGVQRQTILRWLKRGYVPGAELKVFGGFKVWQIPVEAISMDTPVMGSAYLMRERSIVAS